ncbi:hypothetical protein OPV22_001656 [Ensete ventricosum]|uniref:SWIM-type domain-containing protein n=1 Tax=Ensete ventricosum TaxID=4639 RepID=A0AAV8RWF6_ENSVE|nr:hypothetical protein OPV22_001656 [Ensete ventricosum]
MANSCCRNQASVDWIVNLIEERLRSNVNYRPKDILQDIQKQYGISIPYKQAWRAKERGLTAIYGSSEEGYSLLPAYCEQIKLRNPGSVAQVFTTVAFGIVDMETDESWMWFLSEFHKLIQMSTETRPQLIVLSNGQTVVTEAVRRKFPTAYQGICMRHLTESMNKEFKNSRLVHLLWKAAYSVTTSGFRDRMAEIEEVCAEAAKRIQQIPPNQWVVVYLEGPRYGHLSSNIEEFNRWILEARELPVIQVIESIHGKLMKEFSECHEKGSKWTSRLAPTAEKHISEAIERSVGYGVLRSDEVEFEVLSADCSSIVNIGMRSCSCREWQLHGIPCSHAVAALLSCKKDIYEYTEKYFTVTKYRETYSKPVYPIPDRSEWSKAIEGQADNENQVVRPPKFRRPPGRPEKKRLCMEENNRERHTVHCSRCSQTGHYKRTCKAVIIQKT